MNYTESHRLPQWEKSDRILMDDFNQAMSRIEAGLNTAGDAAVQAAAKAQSTADSALAKANAAQSSANNAFSPSRLPFATGSYSGNSGTQSITLGFQPRFLIISCQRITTGPASGDVVVSGPGDQLSKIIQWTSTGFQVVYLEASGQIYPSVNQSGYLYTFIAFR